MTTCIDDRNANRLALKPMLDTEAARNLTHNLAMAKRGYGTGHLYEKHGSYYGRWGTLDGRGVNRLIGLTRLAGGSRTKAGAAFGRTVRQPASGP